MRKPQGKYYTLIIVHVDQGLICKSTGKKPIQVRNNCEMYFGVFHTYGNNMLTVFERKQFVPMPKIVKTWHFV